MPRPRDMRRSAPRGQRVFLARAMDVASGAWPRPTRLQCPWMCRSAPRDQPNAPPERAAIAMSLRDGMLPAATSTMPAERLLAVAAEEGVLPLLEWRLRGQSLPEALREGLSRGAREAAVQCLYREMELRKVERVLNRDGINALLLKGNALGIWLYQEPYLRVNSDIDLLFESRQSAELAVAAFSELGYMLSFTPAVNNYEMTCRLVVDGSSRCELDLHCRLVNSAAYADVLSFEELWHAATPLPALAGGLKALSPVHALMHACMNRALDMQNGLPDRLKLLYDIHLLLGRMDDQAWDALIELARAKNMAGVCLRSIDDTIAVFATTAPSAAIQALCAAADSEPLDRHRLDDWRYMQWQNLKALPGPAARLRWLWQRLFPTLSHLRELHGEGSWLQLMGRRARRGLLRLWNRG